MQVDTFVVPCRLSRDAGYVRGWFARVNGLQTIVNARRARADEHPQGSGEPGPSIHVDASLTGPWAGRWRGR